MEKLHNRFMKKGVVLTSLLITFLVSCQKETQKDDKNYQSQNSISMNKEVDILKNQLKKGLKATVGDAVDYQIEYNDEDVKAEGQIVKDILKQNGYKPLTNDEFNARIKEVFQRQIDTASDKEYLYVNLIAPCSNEVVFYKNNLIDYDGIFVYKKNNFIAPLFAIPELIDYQDKYPEVIHFEENLSGDYKSPEGDKVVMKKWMNEKDLKQKRYENIQSIVARNKYLFNNSKADFVWLKTNDEVFLKSLVKTFGYVKDPELLSFVLNSDYKNPPELEKILWNKRCSGEIVFNKEVMDVISHSKSEEQRSYLAAIQEYIVKEILNKKSSMSFAKKAEILGKLAYYGEKMGEKVGMQYQFFSSLNSIDGKQYEHEFKKNNYYHLPDFKNVWEETKMGGVALPGME